MATCASTLSALLASGHLNDLEELPNNVAVSFTGLSFAVSKLYRFSSSKSQTITLTTNITPTGPIQTFLVYITIFYLSGNTIVNQGTSVVVDQNQIFQKDIEAGEYFICLSVPSGTYAGSLKINYIGYAPYAKFEVDFYSGVYSKLLKLDQDKLEHQCKYPIFYELVDGELPEGLILTGSGKITGTISNMDCVESNKSLPPSVNWFGEHAATKEYHAWTKPYKFKVKIWLADFPTIIQYRWFCIRIYNNWSLDRDLLISLLPMEGVIPEAVIPTAEVFRLPETMCLPCVDASVINTEEVLVEEECCFDKITVEDAGALLDVEQEYKHGIQQLYEINMNGTKIKQAPSHKYLVKISESEAEWKEVKDLQVGDKIIFLQESFNG